MTPDENPQSLIIEGKAISFSSILKRDWENSGLNGYSLQTLDFCCRWLSGTEEFVIKTSGSTGTPKDIIIFREQMISSAWATAAALGLKAGQSALACLNTNYIAGMMMLVRGFEIGLTTTVVEPSSNPFESLPESASFDFLSFVPLQMTKILEDKQGRVNQLNKAKVIIIGGAAVSVLLKNRLKEVIPPVFSTYGMTETVSHVALQLLNGEREEECFTALEGVKINTDTRGCLVINSPVTNNVNVVTNDMVELIDKRRFRFVGRADNIINSGGVKVWPDKVEKAIADIMEELHLFNRYFIYGCPDETLGNKVTLFIEGQPLDDQYEWKMEELLKGKLTVHEFPREIRYVDAFSETLTGKIDKEGTAGGIKIIL